MVTDVGGKEIEEDAHRAEDERQAQERSPACAGRPDAPGSPDTERREERCRQWPGVAPDQRRQGGRDRPDDPGPRIERPRTTDAHATASARRQWVSTIAEPAMMRRMAAAAAVVAASGSGTETMGITPSGRTVRKAGSLPVPS